MQGESKLSLENDAAKRQLKLYMLNKNNVIPNHITKINANTCLVEQDGLRQMLGDNFLKKVVGIDKDLKDMRSIEEKFSASMRKLLPDRKEAVKSKDSKGSWGSPRTNETKSLKGIRSKALNGTKNKTIPNKTKITFL